MEIDITAAAFSTVFVAVAGHIITHLIKQGELNQWKKNVDSKFEEMTATIHELKEIHTLEKLNSQRLQQVSEDVKEQKQMVEKQFSHFNDKIDGLLREVVVTLGKIASK